MHFVTLLDNRSQKISRSSRGVNIRFRGYRPETWIPAELTGIELPVYAIAYNLCPTSRDIYLEFVQNRRRTPTWDSYKGKIIDKVYKIIHKKCEEYAFPTKPRNFDLYAYLTAEMDNIITEAKREHERDLRNIALIPSPGAIGSLDEALKKIIKFETEITSAFLDFQIARVESVNIKTIFTQYFDFNTDLALRAPHQGFRSDATPDFVYGHRVMGDIKSGKWQEFFYHTLVAYALAYEEHTDNDMDYGVILHVETPTSRQIPVHYKTRIELLDDYKRDRFVMVRNRKLEIIQTKADPGKPENSDRCDPACSFFSHCWSD